MDARGLSEVQMVEGTERSNMIELAHWMEEADKVATF
ncbi:sulfur relay (sulfurtransferase) complex TusBCD TusD component (DsrE family) [Peptococcaceae bacterium DYL19]|nr:sulfur relay (sulfurtransferase) complex TusBCD TusD component (DsrE family) [Phosphitispora fastidiosa]